MPFKADQAVSKYTSIFRKISKVFELKKHLIDLKNIIHA